MTFIAVINSNTRATPVGEARAVASSTLSFGPLCLVSVLRMDSLGASSFVWFWGTSWEFEGNFSKAEFCRKRDEGWDTWVISTTLRGIEIFQRTWAPTWADAALSPWPGQNRVAPGAQLLEDWFLERPSLHGGRGYPGLPSVSDRQPRSLSFSWRVSN